MGKLVDKSAKVKAALKKVRVATELKIRKLTQQQITIINNIPDCELDKILHDFVTAVTCIHVKNDMMVSVTPDGLTQRFSKNFKDFVEDITEESVQIDHKYRTILEYVVRSPVCDDELEHITESTPLSAKKVWTLLFGLNVRRALGKELYDGYVLQENVTYVVHAQCGSCIEAITFCRKGTTIYYDSYRCVPGDTTVRKKWVYLYLKK